MAPEDRASVVSSAGGADDRPPGEPPSEPSMRPSSEPSSEPSSGWRRLAAGSAGVLAAAAGLAVAELVAAVLGTTATPVVAVADAVVARVPGWLKDWAIATFGAADKFVLVATVVGLLVGLAALCGLIAVRRRGAGLGLAGGLLGVAALAVLDRPATTVFDLLPTLIGGVVAVVALNRLAEAVATSEAAGPSWDRRAFIKTAAAVAALGVVAVVVGRVLDRRGELEEARAALDLPRELPEATPPPDTSTGVPDAPPWRTPNDVFYRVDTAIALPLVRPDEWRLRVHGLVDREVEIDFDDLVARGLVDRWVTLTCVSNEVGGSLAGNALWTGVPLAGLLAEARPRPEADAVLSTSADGWTSTTPLGALSDGRDALLAVAMNGEPLPVAHGFPVRMVVPGLYGYVSATKWVVDLEVTRFDRAVAYWTTRGWAPQAPIKTASRIDVPRPGAAFPAGRVQVAGTAWAQRRGIAAVEVRVDGGAWREARLAAVPSTDTWRQWLWTWDASPGTHRLEVRAVDGTGEVQTGEIAPPAPDGATGWHAVMVDVQA